MSKPYLGGTGGVKAVNTDTNLQLEDSGKVIFMT